MKKRPFVIKLRREPKHPYPFVRLKSLPSPEILAVALELLKANFGVWVKPSPDKYIDFIFPKGIQVAPAPPNLIEFRHEHGVRFRESVPQLFHVDEDETCPRCRCCTTEWEECWKCGGEGGRDGEELMSEDPLWYMPDDFETCDVCNGNGGWNTCLGQCDENGKHEHHENNL